jgi:outer membrane immunogenic protein
MKSLIIGAAILAVGAVSAHAADIAPRPYTKAPALIVAPVYDWSGIYIGGHGGGVWGDRRFDVPNYNGVFGLIGTLGANADIRGALAGGQMAAA